MDVESAFTSWDENMESGGSYTAIYTHTHAGTHLNELVSQCMPVLALCPIEWC